jgi:23S rRNA pseudouridine1911/1915/1917 synthase
MSTLTIKGDASGQRLDIVLHARYPQLSRAFLQKLCEQGQIQVNGETVKTGYKLKTGDKVTIDYDFSQLSKIPEIELPILYEDDDCLVLNKPAGVLTHSKGAFNPEATVATFVQSKLTDLAGDRAGIVHRLDRATSGVIICGKHPEAVKWLQKQFSQRKVKKTYFAIVEGIPEPAEAIIDMPIGRNQARPQSFRTSSAGKPAQTHYKVIKSAQKGSQMMSLVELKPTTGRTHQLRVHLSHMKWPIVGDSMYGGREAPRLFLHAESLELTLPSKQRRVFRVELPNEFKDYLGA